MKQTLGTIGALVLAGIGFMLVLWGSSALVGKASSQSSPPVPSNMTVQQPGAPQPQTLPQPQGQGVAPAPPQMAPGTTPPPGTRPPDQTEAVVPEIAVFEGYSYDPAGRRDPFRPYGYKELQPIPMDAVTGIPILAEPLQGFDLQDLRLIGIIWEVNNPKAMIRDPKNVLHMIKKDSKIGRNNGFVASIREGEVVIIEPAMVDGLQTAATRILTLQKGK